MSYLDAIASKIEDAQHRLDALENKNTHFLAFRSEFLSSVNAIESIYECVCNFQPVPIKLQDIKKTKLKEIAKDELLLDIHKWRIDDFHHAKQLLQPVVTTTSNLGIITADAGPVTISAEGAYRIINKGKFNERRIPLKQGVVNTQVQLIKKETIHRGNVISDKDPVEILYLALSYYQDLLHCFKKIHNT